MFRYVKGEGKERWRLIDNSEKSIAAAVASGAHFTTVLSLDQDVDNLDDDAKIKYKGPLYFDIDSSDETESLTDCRSLLLSLYKDYGVSLCDLVIHVTGGKGFHILVPPKVFSEGKAKLHLPYTYKNMALEFNLAHLDYGIYSCGKGRQWRIENVRRESGRYKVRLTAAQVFALEWPDLYKLTLTPGPPTPFDFKQVDFSPELSALFRRSEFKPVKQVCVGDDKLRSLTEDPVCVRKLLKVEDVKEGRRFNQFTLLLAAYAKGRGWTLPDLEEKAGLLFEELPSSIYKSTRDKRRHVKSIYNYVMSSASYAFSCAAARKSVNCEFDGCPNCPVAKSLIEEDYDATLGIEIAHNCYFRKTGDGRMQLSTFVVRPTSIIEFIDTRDRSEYTIYAQLISDNDRKSDVTFAQPDWASKSAFIKKLPHPDYAYIGGDTDVQRLFKIIAQLDVPSKTGVKVIGLHKMPTTGAWHYASSEGSLGPNGERNELMLETDYYLPNTLISERVPDVAEVKAIMDSLFDFNDLSITVPIVGWFCAAFFKERIFFHTRQFPLLFIFGAAGAGKTQTILNLKRMFCLGTDNIKSIADVTNFTLLKSTNSNNTIPLMLDEYKATTFNVHQVKMVSKLIRAAYNNEAGERGTAGQVINTYFYRSPIIMAGEQTVTEPAARDRIIEVHMSKDLSRPHINKFKALQQTRLGALGKLLLIEALKVSDDEIKAVFEACHERLPDYYSDRPRVNQAIVATGLHFLANILKPYKLDGVVYKALTQYEAGRKNIAIEEAEENKRSDIDRILEVIALMSDTDDRYKVANDWEFKIELGVLYINMRVVYTKFLKFAEEYRSDVDAMNYTSFLKLIKREPYFMKDNVTFKFKSGPKLCMSLSVDALHAKGLRLDGLIGHADPVEDKPLDL